MKICKLNIAIFLSFFIQFLSRGQGVEGEKKIVKNWDFAILPSLVYNTDKGTQIGALANLYYYDDSLKYPDYKYNLYLQASKTTKKGYVQYLFFDSKNILPDGIRFMADLSSTRYPFQQFYGFNGYDAIYSRRKEYPPNRNGMFGSYYFINRANKTMILDFQGNIFSPHFRFDLGYGYFNILISPFRNRWSKLGPLIHDTTLFDRYVINEAIPSCQKNGGTTSIIKSGLIYDTRDNEVIPTTGVWIDAIFTSAPRVLNGKYNYSQVTLAYRHYITLQPSLVFAYRMVYQSKIAGEMPFYMLPYMIGTYQTQEALGGAKTLRGILNERLEGNGFALGNFEIRYKAIKATILGNTYEVAFNVFTDMGLITNKYRINRSLNVNDFDYQFRKEKIHQSVGSGIRIIYNHNFIVSFDYGKAMNPADGLQGFYLDLDYLF